MKKTSYFLSSLIGLSTLSGGNVVASETLVQEITVTATRREAKLQDVPVSITAFDGSALENARLSSIEDIALLTPGMLGSSFNEANPIFAVRGITNTFSAAGTSKPVGVFIDDVFISRSSASDFDLFDLEQVAVLRGPQGTLFGRNVTAGAIQITTAKPSLDGSYFKVKAGGGNLDFYEFAALANGPLSDRLAGKVSVSHKRRDGFIKDRFNGLDYNDINTYSLRGQLLFQPSDKLEIIASVDYSNDDTNSRGYTFTSNDLDRTDTAGNDGNIRTAELNVPQFFDRDIWGVSLTANWQLPAGSLTSVTAYRESEAHELSSLSPGAYLLTASRGQTVQDDLDKPKTFSQEVRFVSEVSDTFDYVAGLYIFLNETQRTRHEYRGAGEPFTGSPMDNFYTTTADNDSYAIYGDATFHLFDGALDLSLGGRYTTEEVSIDVGYDNRLALPGVGDFTDSDSDTFNEFTTRAVLTWYATENLNFFASRTEGFTAGGFNSEVNDARVLDYKIDPETLTAYELGVKSSWLDGRLIANLTLFKQDYKDKQEGYFDRVDFIFSIFNAAKATIEGAELELTFAPSEVVSFNFSYAYLNTEYDAFVIPGDPNGDYTGNSLSNAPENTFSGSVNIRQPIDGAGYFLFNANISDTDDYFTGASNIPDFLVGNYTLVNTNIGYESANGQWRFNLWANNLTNEEYVLIRGNQFGIGENYGAPRTYGATITYTLD